MVNRSCRKIDAKRRDEHGGGTPGAVEVGLHSVARYRRIDDQRIGKLGRGFDPGEMVCRLAGLGVFGKFDGNEIMDQTDEARPAALFQPCDKSALFEVVVGNQQVDRLRPAGPQLRHERSRTADEQCDASLAPPGARQEA